HDGAQQRLLALAIRLNLASELAAQGDSRHTLEQLEEAEADLRSAVDELRDLAHGIHPAVLTDLGLAQAIRSVCARSALPVRVVELPSRRVDQAAESAAYFVFTEALANAQKHAHSSLVDVSVSTVNGTLRMEIADDGVGGAHETPGSGLRGLRDRVEGLG